MTNTEISPNLQNIPRKTTAKCSIPRRTPCVFSFMMIHLEKGLEALVLRGHYAGTKMNGHVLRSN